jgi:MFS family permease
MQAFSTVPAPLYPLYQRQDGFSAFTVTIVFAVYAVGVITSLVLAGHVSDWTGRKRTLLPALGVEIVAAVLFLAWPALPGLILARFLTGIGVGLVSATATAYLLELHVAERPDSGRGRFEIVSAAANLGGLGVGTLVSGALAQSVTAPLRTPYVVFLVLLTLGVVAVAATPETVIAPAVRPRYRPQRPRAGAGGRRAYLVAAGGAFAAFAVFGLFTSLAPSFVAGALHHPSRLLAGLVAFLVFGAGATAQGHHGEAERAAAVRGRVGRPGGGRARAGGGCAVDLALALPGRRGARRGRLGTVVQIGRRRDRGGGPGSDPRRGAGRTVPGRLSRFGRTGAGARGGDPVRVRDHRASLVHRLAPGPADLDRGAGFPTLSRPAGKSVNRPLISQARWLPDGTIREFEFLLRNAGPGQKARSSSE